VIGRAPPIFNRGKRMTDENSISIREIAPSDFQVLARFLGEGLGYQPARFLRIFWAMEQIPLVAGFSKYGFVLETQGRIVGALLTIHSKIIHSIPEHVRCHLTGWYVLPEYTFYSTLLEKRATRGSNVSYINTSARPNTYKIIQAQGFRKYSKGQFIIMNLLHALDRNKGADMLVHEDASGYYHNMPEFELMKVHARLGSICLWGLKDGHAHPFILQKKKLKGFLPAAQLIFCRDVTDVSTFIGPLSRHLMSRGIFIISMDANEPIPNLHGVYFEGLEPRFYKGVAPSQGDLAYTLNAISPIVRRQKSLSRR
jgi:hypothetical protein